MDQGRRARTRGGPLERIRFGLELLVLRGLGYRLLLAAGIIAAVALMAGVMLWGLGAGSADLGEDLWWAFLRLTDPGYLGDDEGVVGRSISTVVTVLGYVLFLGLLIAIMTQWLNGWIGRLEAGTTPVAIADHVVILGWTHRTPTIVAELMATRERLRRFLERHGAQQLRIVVLAERVDAGLMAELRERTGAPWRHGRVLLRSGSPLRIDHLERAAFREAAALILPGAEFGEERPEAVDAQTVKTLMAVSEHATAAGSTTPLAVAEIFDGRRAAVAREAYAGECEVLATDEIVSRLIAQSLRQRGLCDVFRELLTLNVGNAIHVHPPGELVGRRFAELRGGFARAIPLGTVRVGEERPSLNPPPEATIAADDLLVFLARSHDDCAPPPDGLPECAPDPPALDPRPGSGGPGGRRILVLGWSRKAPALLRELEVFGNASFDVDVVSATPLAERDRALARTGVAAGSLRVRQIEAGYTGPGVLEGLAPAGYDDVVVLASERLDQESEADAASVLAYLLLRGLLRGARPRPRVLVELLDEENEFLFARGEDDALVSPLLVSYLLSQVALRRELNAVYAELSRSGGAQMAMVPAAELAPGPTAVRFADLERAAAARGEIALGVRRAAAAEASEEPGGGLELNPDRASTWSFGPGDEVVVLRSSAEPGAPA